MKKIQVGFISLTLLVILLVPSPVHAQAGVKIKLYGGYGYLLGGDLNKGTEGISNVYLDIFRAMSWSINGSFKPAHFGVNFGGDLIFMFAPTVGIGLGADYLQASAEATVTATQGSNTFRAITKPTASAVPLKASLYFCLPTGTGFSMNFHFGAGYYLAKMSNSVRFEEGGDFLEYANKAEAKGFGFHGGLGFEFDLSPNVSLFIEAQGRYAKLGGFTGDITFSSGGGSDSEHGKLYYYETEGILPQWYSVIFISATAPTPSPFTRNVREAKIDFSGGSAVGGIVFRF